MTRKIKIGFNNDIIINKDYLKKIWYNTNRREKFLIELKFYQNNKYDFMPDFFQYNDDIDNMFIVIEKIKGQNLFTIWSQLTQNDREKVIINLKKACDLLHETVSKDNYKNIYLETFDNYLNNIINNDILKDEKLINELYSIRNYINQHFYMKNCYRIHGDLQFNNIIYINNNNLKLVDFEHIEYAPIEKELYSIFRMADDPQSFVNTDNDVLIDTEAFKSIKGLIKNVIPETCSNEHFEYNLFLFEILNSMRWIEKYPNCEKYRYNLFEKAKIMMR